MDDQRILLRPPVWLPLAIVLIAGAFYIAGKHIENEPQDRATISVQGEGTVTATPDIASLTFGVQTEPQRTAQAAMDILTRDMNAAFEAVQSQGVAEKDIRTESFSLNPQYDWNDGTQTLRGYVATQQLRVKVRDLDTISAVLSAATSAGANQAGGIQFTIDDPDALRAQARADAIADAQAKAEILADSLDVELGDLKQYAEGGAGVPVPMPMYSRAEYGVGGAADMAEVPLPSGEQDVVVHVTLTFALED